MADKRVGDLPAAEALNNEDFFVLEQDGIAKKIAAEVLKGFIDWARNGIPAGGKENQILIKAGEGDYDLEWVSVIDENGYISPLLMPIHYASSETELRVPGTVFKDHLYIVNEHADEIIEEMSKAAPDLWVP